MVGGPCVNWHKGAFPLWYHWSELKNQIKIPGVKPAVLLKTSNNIEQPELTLHSIRNKSLYKYGESQGSLEFPQKWKWRVLKCLLQINLFKLPKISKKLCKNLGRLG